MFSVKIADTDAGISDGKIKEALDKAQASYELADRDAANAADAFSAAYSDVARNLATTQSEVDAAFNEADGAYNDFQNEKSAYNDTITEFDSLKATAVSEATTKSGKAAWYGYREYAFNMAKYLISQEVEGAADFLKGKNTANVKDTLEDTIDKEGANSYKITYTVPGSDVRQTVYYRFDQYDSEGIFTSDPKKIAYIKLVKLQSANDSGGTEWTFSWGSSDTDLTKGISDYINETEASLRNNLDAEAGDAAQGDISVGAEEDTAPGVESEVLGETAAPATEALTEGEEPESDVLGERLAPIVEAAENGSFNRNMLFSEQAKKIPFGMWLFALAFGAAGVLFIAKKRKKKS